MANIRISGIFKAVIFLNKILVSVYVLSLNESFDFLVPINLTGKQFLTLLQEALISLSRGNYLIHEDAFLLNQIDGSLINQNNIIKFSGIKNGSNLLLI